MRTMRIALPVTIWLALTCGLSLYAVAQETAPDKTQSQAAPPAPGTTPDKAPDKNPDTTKDGTAAPQSTETSTKDAKGKKEPKPNPDAEGHYHIGDGVTAPKLVHQVEPEFPSIRDRDRGISAHCMVGLEVGTDGRPHDVVILQSSGECLDPKQQSNAAKFDAAALTAVRQYRFTPAIFHGQPVPVSIHVEISWTKF